MGIAKIIVAIANLHKKAKKGKAQGIGKYIADKTGFTDFAKEVHKRNNVKIPYSEKIKDLATDAGLPKDYIEKLIDPAKSPKPLYAIREYLKSSRNDLPHDVTKELLNAIGRKMYHFTKKFAEYLDVDVTDFF